MSIAKDELSCDGNVCTTSDGSTFTDNGDGTYTVNATGENSEYSGTWTVSEEYTEGAVSADDAAEIFGLPDGYLGDGYYIKQ